MNTLNLLETGLLTSKLIGNHCCSNQMLVFDKCFSLSNWFYTVCVHSPVSPISFRSYSGLTLILKMQFLMTCIVMCVALMSLYLQEEGWFLSNSQNQ